MSFSASISWPSLYFHILLVIMSSFIIVVIPRFFCHYFRSHLFFLFIVLFPYSSILGMIAFYDSYSSSSSSVPVFFSFRIESFFLFANIPIIPMTVIFSYTLSLALFRFLSLQYHISGKMTRIGTHITLYLSFICILYNISTYKSYSTGYPKRHFLGFFIIVTFLTKSLSRIELRAKIYYA